MSKYASGARFERQIIKYLLGKGAVLVMRGAGSKSYGNKIKVDIIAIFDDEYMPLLIQAKHGKRPNKKDKKAFEEYVHKLGYNPLWLSSTEDWKKKIDEVLL